VAAELEPNPAEMVAILVERMSVFNDAERFTEARVNADTDALQQLSMARFYRLQAEAELIQAKEQVEPK
jgi:hypothetical protein